MEEISTHENKRPNITLRNEPKISEHEIDRPFNEMKQSFVLHIQEFVASHPLFKSEPEIGIEFAHKGCLLNNCNN